jgi:uncharacterized protein YydD (DUF2326 family)
MYLISLTIKAGDGEIIREVRFRRGLNLIVDKTPVIKEPEIRSNAEKTTGNNVGKTTVLALIDFCLHGDGKAIYTDPEDKKSEYALVKEYLIKHEVLIVLRIGESLNGNSESEIVIERNFLTNKKKILRINGIDKTDSKLVTIDSDESFEGSLFRQLFDGRFATKPTIRQVISHNIRYKNERIENTLRTLDKYTTDEEYEALYLYLLGCDYTDGDYKQEVISKLKLEEAFKRKLENGQTESSYKVALDLVISDIEALSLKRKKINCDPEYESKLDRLNTIKSRIGSLSVKSTQLKIRERLITEANEELKSKRSNIDYDELRFLYNRAIELVGDVQKSFKELCEFHNGMIDAKIRFINSDLPIIRDEIIQINKEIKELADERNVLQSDISESCSFHALENIIKEQNSKFQEKGRLEGALERIHSSNLNIDQHKRDLASLEEKAFSEDFEKILDNKISEFNKKFSLVSDLLYGEKYALKEDKIVTKRGYKVYKFKSFNTNFSSGKKQGEVLCFDIAYILFARDEGIPCLSFLLNDKKELLHDNQLINVSRFVETHDIQLVISILNDKVPEEIRDSEYVVLSLSQNDKLFRIENSR